ncbi:MAG TPA: hypothetical protein VHY91_09550 [Pirellulales bacterium]|jgi:hypothetical protein|nr:hypothetical protein [Pirellulales bacterium]
MTSRTARQRERRRKARQQATAAPDIVERWGWGERAPAVRGDLALVRKAIRERWAVPDATRERIVDAIMYLVGYPDAPAVDYETARLTTAAFRTVLDMNWANMLAERETLAQRRPIVRRKSSAWNAWRKSIEPPQ